MLIYDWTPDGIPAKGLFAGSQFLLDRVELLSWSQTCENHRPSGAELCANNNPGSFMFYNTTNNGCDYPLSILCTLRLNALT